MTGYGDDGLAGQVRAAGAADVDLLVELMTEFYAEADFRLDAERAGAAFDELLGSPSLGRVWIAEVDGRAAAYVVLTLGYSMEYGGRDAFVDDLFVRPAFRDRGIGRLLLAEVRRACEALGVRALHLEVGRDNDPAQALYRRIGFVESGRQLLTLQLAQPTHIE
jgi:ribosomal protein S18 acetylase RimI-like enzyme